MNTPNNPGLAPYPNAASPFALLARLLTMSQDERTATAQAISTMADFQHGDTYDFCQACEADIGSAPRTEAQDNALSSLIAETLFVGRLGILSLDDIAHFSQAAGNAWAEFDENHTDTEGSLT